MCWATQGKTQLDDTGTGTEKNKHTVCLQGTI